MTADSIKQLISKNSPAWFKSIVKPVYERVAIASFAPPVVQMYICDGEINTRVGINNFYSVLASSQVTEAMVRIKLYSPRGDLISAFNKEIPHFGGVGIDVGVELNRRNLKSDFGMISCEIKPKYPRRPIYKPLGLCASHFFTYYESISGSVGHIHPSSVLDPKSAQSSDFISNQSIFGKGLERIVLLQLNPSHQELEVQHIIYSMVGSSPVKVASRATVLNPLSTNQIEFVRGRDFQLNDTEFLTVGVSPLPTNNSKPMLFRYYKGNRYSVSHS